MLSTGKLIRHFNTAATEGGFQPLTNLQSVPPQGLFQEASIWIETGELPKISIPNPLKILAFSKLKESAPKEPFTKIGLLNTEERISETLSGIIMTLTFTCIYIVINSESTCSPAQYALTLTILSMTVFIEGLLC
jgi:hypothetical protein